MKISNWIDRTFLDSRRKRILTLDIVVGIYWIWECLWCLALYAQMAKAGDYSSLFGLQGVLDEYNGCFLVRIILESVKAYRLRPFQLSGLDILMCIATFIVLVRKNTVVKDGLAAAFAGTFLLEGLFVMMGFEAGSLGQVASLLRWGGITGLVLTGGVALVLLERTVFKAYELIRADKDCKSAD